VRDGVKVVVGVKVEVGVAEGITAGSGGRVNRMGAVLVAAATAGAGGVGVDRGLSTAQAINVQPIIPIPIKPRLMSTSLSLRAKQ